MCKLKEQAILFTVTLIDALASPVASDTMFGMCDPVSDSQFTRVGRCPENAAARADASSNGGWSEVTEQTSPPSLRKFNLPSSVILVRSIGI